ncbi:hypothetical protein [Pseudomonas syringae]|uniref:hypothetical protein n=1 Tax=Pseudomonas syringae TaxID=317 RepID=UPI000CD33655|nr:hypothetical protein [Pseudomonas syringae]MCF5197136.1 hypothetical protein [Pseudomonas syringae]MCF5208403.1 hypothetical protein [Pseudomonas syringae]MCF5212644.1 hypothetical protein [Pseudomonas syringae]MCF5220252.1 hypothetical protein [Pseudomonas syringae]MCF5263588.1 hypothetical protein [Pseudomonas syringae]
MTQNYSPDSGRKIRFGYVVAAKLIHRHYLLGLHEDKEVANAHRDRLQAFHDSKPDLGNIGQISTDEAFTRREELAAWRKNHPLGTALDHFERYEVLDVPWLEPVILTNPII